MPKEPKHIGNRLRAEMDKRKLTVAQVAEMFGVKAPSVYDWLNFGRIAKKHLPKLVAEFGHSMQWWIEGKENNGEANHDELPTPTEDRFAMVPQLDIAAACGEGRYVDHVVVKGGLAFKRSSLRGFGVPENAARIIYAAGGSMWPTIQDGRVVLLNTADRSPKDGKVYAICTPDGGLVLKRLIWDYHPSMGAQTWIMRSDNPDKTAHPDKILPPDDRTMIIGQAVWNDNVL